MTVWSSLSLNDDDLKDRFYLNRASVFGEGFFESIHIKDNQPLYLSEHLQRITQALTFFQMRVPEHWGSVKEKIAEILKDKASENYNRLKILVLSDGDIFTPLSNGIERSYYYLLFDRKEISRSLIHLSVSATRRDKSDGFWRYKTINRLAYLKQIQAVQGLQQNTLPLILDPSGIVLETAHSNIFWIKDGDVYTPSLDLPILNGISRQIIISFLKGKNIRVWEGIYSTTDLLEASHIFISNSIIGYTGVIGLEDKLISHDEKKYQVDLDDYFEGILL